MLVSKPTRWNQRTIKKINRPLLIGIIATLIVVIAWALFPFFLLWAPWSGQSWESRGVFGDSYGVLNALFSGLAFAGVITALFLQHTEISESQQEIEKTVKAIAAGAQLTALSALLTDVNFTISKYLEKPLPAGSVGEIVWQERRLFFEKHRLLVKEILLSLSSLQEASAKSQLEKIMRIEQELGKLGGNDRPLGLDEDEKGNKTANLRS